MKKIVKKIGGEQNLAPGVKEQLKRSVPNSRVVMGRAHRGLFAGRHIQFGNRVSEDGGNKSVYIYIYIYLLFTFSFLFYFFINRWVFIVFCVFVFYFLFVIAFKV